MAREPSGWRTASSGDEEALRDTGTHAKGTQMEVLALVGSPRKGGNTDALIDVLLDRAHGNAHFTKKVYLYDQKIGPCIDCRVCKSGKMTCPLPDDMLSVYRAIDAADVLVFGTPVYWCGPTGPMKLLLDRMRPYFANRRLAGKGAVLVAPAQEGPAEAKLLSEMMRRSFGFLDMRWLGEIFATAYDLGDVQHDVKALEAAASLGESL